MAAGLAAKTGAGTRPPVGDRMYEPVIAGAPAEAWQALARVEAQHLVGDQQRYKSASAGNDFKAVSLKGLAEALKAKGNGGIETI